MSYLLLLYVTLEQEDAIKLLFNQKGWKLIKTDLETAQSGQLTDDVSELPNKTSQAGRFDGSSDLGDIHVTFIPDASVIVDEHSAVDKSTNHGEDQTALVVFTDEAKRSEFSPRKSTRLACKERHFDNAINGVENELPVTDIDRLVLDKETEELAENLITEENVDSWFNNALEFNHNDSHAQNSGRENGSNQTEKNDRKISDLRNRKKYKTQLRKTIRLKIERGKQAFLEKKRKQKGRREEAVNNVIEHVEKSPEVSPTKKKGKKRPVYCQDCKTMFTSQRRYDGHKEKNGGQCVFECEYCGKVFLYRKSKYLIHIRSAHTKERPFICDICNKGYVTSDKLKIHKRTHTGEKPCVCEQCGKAFYSRAELSIHRDYHHNSRENLDDFVCNQCNITFCSKRYLIYHKNVTHSSRRDFNCTKCDKRFKCNTALQRHLKYSHTDSRDFQCNMCEKAFKTPTCLKKHLVRHGGEKGFYCNYCDKGFYEKAKLVQHVRIHTGEKPYKCDLCDYRCALSGNLSKHRKTHYKSL